MINLHGSPSTIDDGPHGVDACRPPLDPPTPQPRVTTHTDGDVGRTDRSRSREVEWWGAPWGLAIIGWAQCASDTRLDLVEQCGVLIEVPDADDIIGQWRSRFDPVAALGVPAHVTILFPFVPPSLLDSGVLAELAQVVHSQTAFEFALVDVGEFSGSVWLRPDPVQPFVDLTNAVFAAFGDYPPYGGQFEEVTPHLTIAYTDGGEGQRRLAQEIRVGLEGRLPMPCSAESVSVYVSDADGRWSRRTVAPLRPQPRTTANR